MVEYLFQQGEISKGVFRKGSHLKILDANGVQGVEADLFDRHSLRDTMEGVDTVYNMASPMPGSDDGFLKTNTEGLLNLLDVASESKVETFVHLSTLDVCGFGARTVGLSTALNLPSEYQKSKAEAERLIDEFSKRSSGPRVVVIRAAKAVGSRDESLVVPILGMLERGRVVLPSAGPMSFSHPRDIAQAMYKAALGKVPTGSRFLVKSFDSTPEELARGIAAASGKQAEFRRQGLLSGSAIPKYTSEQLKAALKLDYQENWKELGYAPKYTLQSVCEEIASWYRKSPWITESA